jgi:hypothetical protein
MSKRKDKRQSAALFSTITATVAATRPLEEDAFEHAESAHGHDHLPISDTVLAMSPVLAQLVVAPEAQRALPKMKKFRFQLLHHWMLSHLQPCRVADVGGGKGLLTYLLQQSGWAATVIDPFDQALPSKYKQFDSNKQTSIPDTARVPRMTQPFSPSMANDFDLLVAMHAHGCNIQLLDAAADFGRCVILLPCCIIHEPLILPPGVHWIQSVVGYALQKGFTVEPFQLNFKGQNIGLYMHL